MARRSATTWDTFTWPAWVPAEVSDPIVQFWSRPGRGLLDWQADAVNQQAPALGAEVLTTGRYPSGQVQGRYVHAWNNMGRLITEAGTIEYVSVSAGRVYRCNTQTDDILGRLEAMMPWLCQEGHITPLPCRRCMGTGDSPTTSGAVCIRCDGRGFEIFTSDDVSAMLKALI